MLFPSISESTAIKLRKKIQIVDITLNFAEVIQFSEKSIFPLHTTFDLQAFSNGVELETPFVVI